MDKKALREVGKETLAALGEDSRKEVHEKLVEHLISSDSWNQARVIGITISGGFEWDTEPIIKQGWKEGKTIVVPKCIPDGRKLEFYQLENFNQLEEGFFNLREPIPEQTVLVEKQAIDLLIVPGLLYDRRGYRVGFGGGYYDRFLADFSNKTVSLLYSRQLIDQVPNENYDIPVQKLITEDGFVK